MSLRDRLDREEAIVLVQLARALVRADGHISDTELDAILILAREVGLDVFADALDRPESPWLTQDELKALAVRVGPQAQPVVLQALVDLGASDGLVDPERDLLWSLATLWELEAPTAR